MMNQESKRPVTIEDLLRLKRAESPKAEFWTEFDHELRTKQLAALVEKRPWWRSVSFSFRGLSRYSLPLGATAVLAITFLAVRDYQPSATLPANPSSSSTATAEADQYRNAAPETVNVETSVAAGHVVVADTTPLAPTAFSSEATAPGELARMVPMLSGDESANAEDVRPSARSIAQNLAAAEVMLGATQPSFETRALPVRSAPREPLAQMENPSESRRSRFAAAFAAMTTENSPAPARVARRLSDEQLYDSIHRFGASGNSVSFKF